MNKKLPIGMRKFSRTVLTSFFLLTLFACATGHNSTQKKLREFVSMGRYQEAVMFLEKSPLQKDKDAQLVVFMEKGIINHYAGNYQASIDSLEAAKKLSGELYTTRISGKLQSIVSNDNADLYYGEKYEASLVHFYLVLNHYQLYLSDPTPQKVAHIQKARAEVLAWDSYIKSMKDDRLGKAVFKDDILAKIFGGMIHEAMGNSTDGQTALLLYRDAWTLLFTNYNAYPSFNNKSDKFLADYDKLPGMERDAVVQNYVTDTHHNVDLRNFLTFKILQLTQKFQGQDYKTWHAQLMPSAEVEASLKQKDQMITLLLQDGLISEKKAKKYHFPIDLASNMHGFASGTLGVGLQSGISYELPEVERKPVAERAMLVVTDASGQMVKQVAVPLLTPIGDLAEQAINEHSSSVAAKTGARLMAKHVAAIVAAYAVYQSMQQQGGNSAAFAGMAATMSYAASSSAIAASEKADTRYWSTLPGAVRMVQVMLPAGEYDFNVQYFGKEPAPVRVISLGKRMVSKEMNGEFIHKAIPGNLLVDPALQKTDRALASDPIVSKPMVR